MAQKFKDEYQKKEITKRRLDELGFRYLQVWFYIFMLYLFANEYLEILSDIAVNNKPIPLLELLVYSFMVAWLIPFSVVYFKEVDLREVKKSILYKIRKQEAKILSYQGQFKGEYPESPRYQRKFDRMKNKLTKLETKLDMLGFDKE